MAPFSKPETVLKQAEGLVSVGQTHAALQSLTEMFSSKRFRSTPLVQLEPIMYRFIELCVDMRKGRTAKEGLMQYKNIAQNTSVASIEAVITRFVQLADAKVRDAQEKAAVKVAVDVDDLEASETPESILLGAVSGDQSKDRTDRALVTPWLKFLWESYRTSLETLKNNARLEVIYQQIAQKAFKFCLENDRKVEFRRLCETLRLHLANVAKYSHQPHSINLSDPETLQHHLDTRFAQLNTSVELELWQEAFRSVEDVHNLLTMAKKAPRPAMMANYYEQLTKIFLMSGNALYHAAAWGRYYAVVLQIGGKSDEEMGRLAGQVLVSALAVPVGLNSDVEEVVKGKNARLTSLLWLSKIPTREGLLARALDLGVLKGAPEIIKKLYHILQVSFEPLTLCESIAPLLYTLAEDAAYAPYRIPLQRALLSRLLSQLSQVYSTIKIAKLLALVAPLKAAGFEGAYDEEQVQAYVMGCALRRELKIRVDHAADSISFIDDAFGATEETSVASTSALETPIQPSRAELVSTRLSQLATCLHNSLVTLYPAPASSLTAEQQAEKLASLVAAAEGERKVLQVKRAVVARRRELVGELAVRKEKEETSRKAEAARREKELEIKRAKDDIARRDRERIQKQLDAARNDEKAKIADAMRAKAGFKITAEELEDLDKDKLVRIQVDQVEKERKEMSERLRIVKKRVDHIERAYRKEERPLLAEDYAQQQTSDRQTFESLKKARVEGSIVGHQQDMETKTRVLRMLPDYQARREAIISKRGAEFEHRSKVAEEKIREEKAKRRAEVLAEREEEERQYQEEERRRAEEQEEEVRLEAEHAAEEERRQNEEEEAAAAKEAKKAEEADKVAAARSARETERAELAEKARLQLQREEEAEARSKAAREARNKPPTRANGVAAPGSGAWAASRASSTLPPARSESPAPTPTAETSRFRPGAGPAPAAGGGAGGWRARAAAAAAGGSVPGSPSPASSALPARSASPAIKPEVPPPAAAGADGFQTVPATGGVWKPRRARGD